MKRREADKFSGLVLEGPMDGQFLEHYSTKYEMRYSANGSKYEEVVYYHRDFYTSNDGKFFDVWILDEKTNDEITEIIVTGYRRPKIT